MKSEEQLIREGIINENKIFSNHVIAQFYVDQLTKFKKLGLGGETENGVIVTKSLIQVTRKRLEKLKPFLRGKIYKITQKKGVQDGTV